MITGGREGVRKHPEPFAPPAAFLHHRMWVEAAAAGGHCSATEGVALIWSKIPFSMTPLVALGGTADLTSRVNLKKSTLQTLFPPGHCVSTAHPAAQANWLKPGNLKVKRVKRMKGFKVALILERGSSTLMCRLWILKADCVGCDTALCFLHDFVWVIERKYELYHQP